MENREKASKAALTTGDVARHCQVSYETVMNWIKGGRLKAYATPGGHRRIPVADFSAFLEEYDMPPLAQRPARPRVLVVDDDPGLVEVIVEYFEDAGGFQLAAASDGFAAGIEVARFVPDLIILDLMMPYLDGFEVCRKVRSTPETADTRILVLTGFASEQNTQRALACGADHCMTKPVRMADLKAAASELLRRGDSRGVPGQQQHS